MPSILTRPSGGGAGGGSVSVVVSDASPSIGDTITITGTASGYTPDSYLFFAYNTVTDEMVFLAEQASSSFNWNVSGVFAGSYEVYVLGVQNGTPDITSYGFESVTVLSNYLLDTAEGTGANFAFAFFKLRAAYTGEAALIRRSSDNAQKAFYFDVNGVLSLLSEDGSGTALGDWIGGDDGYLVTGYSQDTFGVTFTASNAADQQRVIINGALVDLNGAVAMIGDNDIYVISTSLTVNSAFVVAKNEGFNFANYVFGGNGVGFNFGGTAGGVTGIGMFFDNSSFIQTTTEDLNPHLASYLADTGVYVDGSLGVSGTITDLTITRVASRSDLAVGINGKIACIVSYSTDKTTDRAAIEANIDSNFTTSLLP